MTWFRCYASVTLSVDKHLRHHPEIDSQTCLAAYQFHQSETSRGQTWSGVQVFPAPSCAVSICGCPITAREAVLAAGGQAVGAA